MAAGQGHDLEKWRDATVRVAEDFVDAEGNTFPAGATGYVGAIPRGGTTLVLKIFGCASMMRISPVDAERKLVITGLQEDDDAEDDDDQEEGGEA